MLLTPGLFYSSNGSFARIANGNTRVVIGNPMDRSPRAKSEQTEYFTFWSVDPVKPYGLARFANDQETVWMSG